ncbi:AraC family transcriptional regulator [Thalassobacillus pellis]|uniref:AraC family transcriptional regulator n=1 Tax=Thalassobacillus pellis TaxID=748008 RepID=UPI00196037E3|nr:AraC family transcriptional regulator [Thalassobacillus pellis]MBM7551506.1 AraC-like DNA-binding protein/mannose-6-phosphate isomerase-like protein (cupin superfamily) [Thalassobacillus pellis]
MLVGEDFKKGEKFLNQHIKWVQTADTEFQIYYWGAMEKHYDNPVHKHSFFEVCYVLDGEGTYIEDGKVFPLKEGVAFCSRPYRLHQIKSKYGLTLFFVAFDTGAGNKGSWKEELTKDNVLVETGTSSSISFIWEALVMEAAISSHDNIPFVSQLSESLLHALYKQFTRRPSNSQPGTANYNTSLIYNAQLFIKDNLSQPYRLEDVAKYLHISARHLSRLFVKESGESFSAFKRKEQVKGASALLAKTSLPIKEIAENTGFRSVHYFTRVFSREKGKTPSIYRKEFIQRRELEDRNENK